jgi:hypothetical protein
MLRAKHAKKSLHRDLASLIALLVGRSAVVILLVIYLVPYSLFHVFAHKVSYRWLEVAVHILPLNNIGLRVDGRFVYVVW